MKFNRRFASYTALLITISACSGKMQQGTNLATSPDQANQSFADRLAKTAKVKETLQSLSDALKPIDSSLKDISRILGSEQDNLQNNLPGFAVSELHYAVHSLENQMAVPQADGSWVVEQSVSWPFERASANGKSCDQTLVGVSIRDSREEENAQNAEVYLDDCAFASRTVIAKLHQHADGSISTEFNADFASQMSDQVIASNGCTLQLSPSGSSASLSCDPFQQTVQNVSLSFSSFQYSLDSSGTSLNFSASATRTTDGKALGMITLSQAPGQALQSSMTRP